MSLEIIIRILIISSLLFCSKLQFKLSSILFEFYDRKLTELIQPIVTQICSQIKRIDVPDDQFQPLPDLSATNMGTTLFELYLILKRFLTLGKFSVSILLIQIFIIIIIPGNFDVSPPG